MKILGLKSILGMAALYGAVQYTRKHGGLRQVMDDTLDKLREATQARRGQVGASGSVEEDLPPVDMDVGASTQFEGSAGYETTAVPFEDPSIADSYLADDDERRGGT